MNLIFLDIDGVLGTDASTFYWSSKDKLPMFEAGKREFYDYELLCPVLLSNLDIILDKCKDTYIVVSSTWRKRRKINILRKIFEEQGFRNANKIIDYTPVISFSSIREEEIEEWIKQYNGKHGSIDKYVILDDGHGFPNHEENFIKTHQYTGLIWDMVLDIIKRFDGKHPGIILM